MKKTALMALTAVILCTACAAPTEGIGLPVFTSVRDVLDSTEGYEVTIHEHESDIVLILEMDGRNIRMGVRLDGHAKNLYKTLRETDFSAPAREAFEAYAWTLPLSFTEELEAPLTRAELDGLAGKTLRELMDAGFGEEMILSPEQLASPVSISLEYGFYKYEFDVTNIASGDPYIMTVRSVKPNGFSRAAFRIGAD